MPHRTPRRLLWTWAVLGCGASSTHHLADSGTDAPVTHHDDTATAEAASGPVTLLATFGGSAEPGVHVIFQDSAAGSSLAASMDTDAGGSATAVVAAGGYVTAIDETAGLESVDIFTWQGVQPGDVLRLDRGQTFGQITDIEFTISYPLDAAGSAVSEMLWSEAIDEALGPSPQTTIIEARGSQTNMLVQALDANQQPVGAIYVRDVALVNDGSAMLTGTYAPVPSVAVTIANPGSAYTSGGTVYSEFTSLGEIYTATGAQFPSAGSNLTLELAEGGAPDPSRVPGLVVQESPNGVVFSQQAYVAWGSNAVAPTTVDFSKVALPDFTSDGGQLDPSTDSVAWSIGAPTAIGYGDFVFASYQLARSEGSASASWTWIEVAPTPQAAPGTLAFPTLPATDFDFNPIAGDAPAVDITNVAYGPGYAAARASAIDLFEALNVDEISGPRSRDVLGSADGGGDLVFETRAVAGGG